MKRRTLLAGRAGRVTGASLLVAMFGGAAMPAQSDDSSAGAALLFAGQPPLLSVQQQLDIFRMLGLKVADDGMGLADQNCGMPVTSSVELRDLNGDQRPEVIVTYGNACMSGMAGSSIALFVADAGGQYRFNLGFPGVLAEVLGSGNQGYPDLLIGGPGFCFPVWRWNGREYQHLRDEPQSEGGCNR